MEGGWKGTGPRALSAAYKLEAILAALAQAVEAMAANHERRLVSHRQADRARAHCERDRWGTEQKSIKKHA